MEGEGKGRGGRVEHWWPRSQATSAGGAAEWPVACPPTEGEGGQRLIPPTPMHSHHAPLPLRLWLGVRDALFSAVQIEGVGRKG